MPFPIERYYSVQEISALIGMAPELVRAHCASGLLPSSRFNDGPYRVRESELRRWLRYQEETTREKVLKQPARSALKRLRIGSGDSPRGAAKPTMPAANDEN